MPVSGFPNQTACVLVRFLCNLRKFTFVLCRATQEDELGELYLSNMDFLLNGVPASIIATLVRFMSFLDCEYDF